MQRDSSDCSQGFAGVADVAGQLPDRIKIHAEVEQGAQESVARLW
jgi:hypothetical protein